MHLARRVAKLTHIHTTKTRKIQPFAITEYSGPCTLEHLAVDFPRNGVADERRTYDIWLKHYVNDKEYVSLPYKQSDGQPYSSPAAGWLLHECYNNSKAWRRHLAMVQYQILHGHGYCFSTMGRTAVGVHILAATDNSHIKVKHLFASEWFRVLYYAGHIHETFSIWQSTEGHHAHIGPGRHYKTKDFIDAACRIKENSDYNRLEDYYLGSMVEAVTPAEKPVAMWLTVVITCIMSVIAMIFPEVGKAVRKYFEDRSGHRNHLDLEAPARRRSWDGFDSNPYGRSKFRREAKRPRASGWGSFVSMIGIMIMSQLTFLLTNPTFWNDAITYITDFYRYRRSHPSVRPSRRRRGFGILDILQDSVDSIVHSITRNCGFYVQRFKFRFGVFLLRYGIVSAHRTSPQVRMAVDVLDLQSAYREEPTDLQVSVGEAVESAIDFGSSTTYDLTSFVVRWVVVSKNTHMTPGLWTSMAMDLFGVLCRLKRSVPIKQRDPVWNCVIGLLGLKPEDLRREAADDDNSDWSKWFEKVNNIFRAWSEASSGGKELVSAIFGVVAAAPFMTMGYDTEVVKDCVTNVRDHLKVLPSIERVLDAALNLAARVVSLIGMPGVAQKIEMLCNPSESELKFVDCMNKYRDLSYGVSKDCAAVLLVIEECINSYKRKLSNPMLRDTEKNHYTMRLKTLGDWKLEVESLLASFKERFRTICVWIVGGSQLGKSTLIGYLCDLVCKVFNIRKSIVQILMKIWDDGIMPLHQIGVMDDVPDVVGDDEEPGIEKIRRHCNVANQPLNMSEADKKGRIFHDMKFLFVNSNGYSMGCQKVANAYAGYNRIDIAYEVVGDPELGEKVGRKFLPKDRANRIKPIPTHLKFQRIDVQLDDSRVPVIKRLDSPMSYEEMKVDFVKRAQECWAASTKQRDASNRQVELCEHYNYQGDCESCDKQEHGALQRETMVNRCALAFVGANLGLWYYRLVDGTFLFNFALLHTRTRMRMYFISVVLVVGSFLFRNVHYDAVTFTVVVLTGMILLTEPYKQVSLITANTIQQIVPPAHTLGSIMIGSVSAATLLYGFKLLRSKWVTPLMREAAKVEEEDELSVTTEEVSEEATGKEVVNRVHEEFKLDEPMLPWIKAERSQCIGSSSGSGASVDSAITAVRKRMWDVVYNGVVQGKIIVAQTGLLLMNDHARQNWSKLSELTVQRYVGDRLVTRRFIIDWADYQHRTDIDICVVRCLSGTPPTSSMLPWVIKDSGNAATDGVLVLPDRKAELVIERSFIKVDVDGTTTTYGVTNASGMRSYVGLCGAVYIDKATKSIIGIHGAGMGDSRLYYCPFTESDLKGLIEKMSRLPPVHQCTKKTWFAGKPEEGVDHPKAVHNHLTGNCIVTIEGFVNRHNAGNSNFTANPYWKCVRKHLGLPDVVNYVTPNFRAASVVTRSLMIAANTQLGHPSLALAKRAYESLRRLSKRAIKAPYQRTAPITVDEMLHGIPGHPHHNGRDLQTSAGMYMRHKAGRLLDGDHDDRGPLTAEASADFINVMLDICDGQTSGTMGNLLFKDEPLATSKIKDYLNGAPPRAFVADSFMFYAATSCLLEPVMGYILDNPGPFQHALAIDPLGNEWELNERIFDVTDDNMQAPSDASKWDHNLLTIALHYGATLVMDASSDIGYDKTHQEAVYRVSFECGCRYVNYNGVIASADNLWQSGMKLTALMGSLINCLYVAMVFYKLNDELEYEDEMRLTTVGDDNRPAVVKDSLANWNPVDVCDVYRQLGMTVTPETKDGALRFVSKDEVVFLRRNTVYNHDLGYRVGALEKASILRPFELWESTPNPHTKFNEIFRSACREMVAYGRDEFNTFRDAILNVMDECGIPVDTTNTEYDKYIEDILHANSMRRFRNFGIRREAGCPIQIFNDTGVYCSEEEFIPTGNCEQYAIVNGTIIPEMCGGTERPTLEAWPWLMWIALILDAACNWAVVNKKVRIKLGTLTTVCAKYWFILYPMWRLPYNLLIGCFSTFLFMVSIHLQHGHALEEIVPECANEAYRTWRTYNDENRRTRVRRRLYPTHAVVLDRTEHFDEPNVIHGLRREAGTLEVGTGMEETIENVTAEMPALEEDHITFSDGTMLSSTLDQHTVPQLALREVLIARTALPTDNFFSYSWDVLGTIFSDPVIRNRLRTFHAGNWDITVRGTIAASRFHSGRMRCHYMYEPNILDVYNELNLIHNQRSVLTACRHHVDTEIAEEAAFEITIPWFDPRGKRYFSDTAMRNYVSLRLDALAPVRHPDSTARAPVLTLYARLSRIDVVGSVNLDFQAKTTPSEDHPPPSVVLGHLGDAASVMASVPALAVPAQVAATALKGISGAARLLGHSRPLNTQGDPYVPTPLSGFASANLSHVGNALAFDHQQGGAVDARIGGTEFDIMSYAYFSSKACPLLFMMIPANQSPDEQIVAIPVTPMLAVVDDGNFLPLACAIPAMINMFWHATLCYDIIFTCPITAAGRVRVSWCPADATSIDHTVNFTYLLDLKTTRHLKVEVAMAQPDNFLRTGNFSFASSSFDPVRHNGMLDVRLETPLIGLDELQGIDVRIDVSVKDFLYGDPDYSLCDFYDLGVPQSTRTVDPDNVVFNYDRTIPFPGDDLTPPAEGSSYPVTSAPTPALGPEGTTSAATTVSATTTTTVAATTTSTTTLPTTSNGQVVYLEVPVELWGTGKAGVISVDGVVTHGGSQYNLGFPSPGGRGLVYTTANLIDSPQSIVFVEAGPVPDSYRLSRNDDMMGFASVYSGSKAVTTQIFTEMPADLAFYVVEAAQIPGYSVLQNRGFEVILLKETTDLSPSRNLTFNVPNHSSTLWDKSAIGIIVRGNVQIYEDGVNISGLIASNNVRSFTFRVNPGTQILVNASGTDAYIYSYAYVGPKLRREAGELEDKTALFQVNHPQLNHEDLMKVHVGEWNHSLRTHCKIPMWKNKTIASAGRIQRTIYQRSTWDLTPMNLLFAMYGGYRGGIVHTYEAIDNIKRLYITRGEYTGGNANLLYRGREILAPSVNPCLTVMVPYMSRFRFLYGRRSTQTNEDNNVCVVIEPAYVNNSNVYTFQTYESLGEDFSPIHFLGPPFLVRK